MTGTKITKKYITDLFKAIDYKSAYDKVHIELYAQLNQGVLTYDEQTELLNHMNELYDALSC